MRWRCEWCGKPHERNDPPCDECGHHAFERAVVPAAPEEEVQDYVWVCPECGRAHPRNAPPCSRCGHMELERRSPSYLDPGTVEEGGWLDAVDRPTAVLALVAVGLVVVLALGFLGVLDLPGFGPPTVRDVPGEAESAAGLSLAGVEEAYVAGLEGELSIDAGLERQDGLAALATYHNQRQVKAVYGDGRPPDVEAVAGEFDYSCPGPLVLTEYRVGGEGAISTFESEAALADAMLGRYVESGSPDRFDESPSAVGVDVHVAPDGTIFVTQLLC